MHGIVGAILALPLQLLLFACVRQVVRLIAAVIRGGPPPAHPYRNAVVCSQCGEPSVRVAFYRDAPWCNKCVVALPEAFL